MLALRRAVAQSDKNRNKLERYVWGKNKLISKVKKDNVFILYFACRGEL